MKTDSAKLICLACYQDRLASVCENADGYKLFEIRDDNFYPAGLLSLPSKDPMDRTSAILACGVTIFLCGAIRNRTRHALERAGITVIPWLTGTENQVLEGYLHDGLAELTMPGATV
ncbi:dinitrogenase iron-molybdenum cofactor biosynthesis protein [Pseudodesulfovibrio thermohalotolerans]|uniref:NifB/NifX family molybdenum-iron cluster-binding protein n=1 Tax=Pseudodesulfovibrio thermohalotolerans TaxID=2880651 RepID=UPI0024431FED|nr:dinitrogenase iron-molybdenum cofactor biosynthesis protein [Pseudodesulfovibrio thermohalotolerans]WFS62076.1 dinitrogenase iron-molybdenum cofactor biosynthesis protein [Pseudodesulfovibrio thermohalotolerans]